MKEWLVRMNCNNFHETAYLFSESHYEYQQQLTIVYLLVIFNIFRRLLSSMNYGPHLTRTQDKVLRDLVSFSFIYRKAIVMKMPQMFQMSRSARLLYHLLIINETYNCSRYSDITNDITRFFCFNYLIILIGNV